MVKHGLNSKMRIRPNWSLIWERGLHVLEKERREEEEEEEEEEGRRQKEQRFGNYACMETSFVWNSKDLYGIV